MRINVSEAYREEFEVFISKYQQLCDNFIDLGVDDRIAELIAYVRHNHPDIFRRLTGTVLSRDIMKGIVNKGSITNITPLLEVIQRRNSIEGIGMIRDYKRSLDEYLSKLRARYVLGSSKDIVNAEEIIFILDWTPDDTSFPHIKRLLYKAFHHLDKRIIVQDTGKKILHLLNKFIIILYCNNCFIAACLMLWLLQTILFIVFSLSHMHVCTHTHTHTCVSISLLLYVV